MLTMLTFLTPQPGTRGGTQSQSPQLTSDVDKNIQPLKPRLLLQSLNSPNNSFKAIIRHCGLKGALMRHVHAAKFTFVFLFCATSYETGSDVTSAKAALMTPTDHKSHTCSCSNAQTRLFGRFSSSCVSYCNHPMFRGVLSWSPWR